MRAPLNNTGCDRPDGEIGWAATNVSFLHLIDLLSVVIFQFFFSLGCIMYEGERQVNTEAILKNQDLSYLYKRFALTDPWHYGI